MGLPMKYHLIGEDVWHDGWLNSISSTDIAFSGTEGAEVDTLLEIRVPLPRPRKPERGGTIFSKARVTRSWTVSRGPKHWFILAALSSPRLLRSKSEADRESERM